MKHEIIFFFIVALVVSSCTSIQIKKGSWAKESDSSSSSSSTASSSGTTTSSTYSAPWRKSADTSVSSVAVIGKRHAALPTPGGKVLAVAHSIVSNGEIILGACWDFVNTVYGQAGYTSKKREKLYLEKETGPFADPGTLLPGDWVMYRNLPYGEIGHSAIFVEWIDFDRRSALTIEYVGGNRKVPGRYREADLTKIWGIYRGKD
ncbi:MAG: hypothetical protein JW904_07305 [Spirochaetales bacterium]|nr:hypothetical protein [Spirochaetales bacterium]